MGKREADWASVSHGTYLCMDCAGRHRGLGVHLSFVRSTTMDLWSTEQLRRMQLGGTQQFHEFLKLYPRLCTPPRTMDELSVRYRSHAAAHYRRLLDIRCDGADGAEIRAPSPDRGHDPVDEHVQSNELGSPPAWFGEHREKEAAQDTDHPMNSFGQQCTMLEVAFQRHKHHLQRLPLSSADTSFHDRLPVLQSLPCHERRGCSEAAAEALVKRSCDDPTLCQGSSQALETDPVPLDTLQSNMMGQSVLQNKPDVEVQTPANMLQKVAVEASDAGTCSDPGGSRLLSDQATILLAAAQDAAAQDAAAVDDIGTKPAEHLDGVVQQEELANTAEHLGPKDDHLGETSYEVAEAVFG